MADQGGFRVSGTPPPPTPKNILKNRIFFTKFEVWNHLLLFRKPPYDLETSTVGGLDPPLDKMVKTSEFDVGTDVLIPISHVNRGKEDPRNALPRVIELNDRGYKLGTPEGMFIIGAYC